MKKRLFVALAALLLLAGCTVQDVRSKISRELGIDVSKGTITSSYDTHGGWLGDGTSCFAIQFEGGAVLEEIRSSLEWSEFPLDDTVRALVSMMNGSEEHPIIPEIQNGYYRLIDRQNDATADILHRYSFNFTLGLYDTDTNILYFCTLDT